MPKRGFSLKIAEEVQQMNDTGIIHSTQTDAALGTSQIGKCDVNQLAGGQLDKIQRGRIIPEVTFTYFQPLLMIISKSYRENPVKSLV